MFCSKCGKEIPDNSSFCQFCGNKIEFVEQKEDNHEFKQTAPSVEFGEYTDARRKAVTLTLTAGIIGLLFLLMVLIFGFNFATIILAVLLMVFLTMRTAAYKKSEMHSIITTERRLKTSMKNQKVINKTLDSNLLRHVQV